MKRVYGEWDPFGGNVAGSSVLLLGPTAAFEARSTCGRVRKGLVNPSQL